MIFRSSKYFASTSGGGGGFGQRFALCACVLDLVVDVENLGFGAGGGELLFELSRHLLERTKVNAELAAACTLAAARRVRAAFSSESHVVLVICGGNVSLDDWVDYHGRFN